MPPCIPIPKLATPSLPTSINLTPPLPPINVDLELGNLCCILPPGLAVKVHVALPPLVVNIPFVAEIEAAIEVAENYIASLIPDCPRQ
jgi:hypothetical protein